MKKALIICLFFLFQVPLSNAGPSPQPKGHTDLSRQHEEALHQKKRKFQVRQIFKKQQNRKGLLDKIPTRKKILIWGSIITALLSLLFLPFAALSFAIFFAWYMKERKNDGVSSGKAPGEHKPNPKIAKIFKGIGIFLLLAGLVATVPLVAAGSYGAYLSLIASVLGIALTIIAQISINSQKKHKMSDAKEASSVG